VSPAGVGRLAVISVGVALGIAIGAGVACAQDAPPLGEPVPTSARFDLHFQFTTVTQYHPGFSADYSGKNSLSPDPEHATTVTSTLFLGARLWQGAELYVDPELSGGSGLSSTFGIAGFTNGEATRVGSPEPHVYLGRLMLRQTFALGPEMEPVEEDANQLAGERPVRRWSITVGKFDIVDFFDGNTYSHDPRTQFLNWADWTAGAWDFAADTRGYTWGFVIERADRDWTVLFGATAQPKVANGLQLDTDLLHAYSLEAQYERRFELGGRKGAGRVIVFYNRADMGNYDEAIDQAGDQPPDVTATRRVGRAKVGFVLNLEQDLGHDMGAFLRVSWNDGHNEAWAYAEIERSVTGGVLRKAPFAGRPDDSAGAALIVNGLSSGHRDYLAAGGYGFMIGDGHLSYGLETVAEAFYEALLHQHVWLTADYQFVLNPAYNRDRGPVNVFGARVHVEF
jgi:high affinity Mn2+ porin